MNVLIAITDVIIGYHVLNTHPHSVHGPKAVTHDQQTFSTFPFANKLVVTLFLHSLLSLTDLNIGLSQ